MLHLLETRPQYGCSGFCGAISHILQKSVNHHRIPGQKWVQACVRAKVLTKACHLEDNAFRAAWRTSKNFGHRHVLLEHNNIHLYELELWRNDLREYVAMHGMAKMKYQALTWETITRLSWIAAYADLENSIRGTFNDTLISCIKDKMAGEGSVDLSSRLCLAIVSVGQQLDPQGQLVEELSSTLDIDFDRFDQKKLVQYASILVLSNVNDQRFTNVLSVRIEHGLLLKLNPLEFGHVLNNIARTPWIALTKNQKNQILECALKMKRHLDNKNIVSLVQILAQIPQISEKDIDAISDVVSASMDRLDMKELGLIAKQYAILYSRDSRAKGPELVLGKIAENATRCVEGADPKDVVRLIQAFQAAELKPETLLDVLDIWADKRLASMNAQGISLAMAHFARVGEASPRLLKTAVSVVESNLEQLAPSDASKLAWSFAHLSYHPGENLLEKCLGYLQSSSTVRRLSDREIANLFWGLVKLEHYPSVNERLHIAASLYANPGRVSGQSSALLLWSFASSHEAMGGILHDGGFDNTIYRLGLELCRDILSVDSQSISMTSWSLGVLKVPHHDFAKSLSTVASEGRLQIFDPQHVSNLLWGLAKSGSHPSHEFLEEVTGVLSGNLSMYSPQELFNVCWSFATLQFRAPSVAAETVTELKARSTEFQGLELSGIAWALGRLLDIEPDIILSEKACLILQRELCKHIDDLEMSQLAMALVGLARLSSPNNLNCMHPDFVESVLDKVIECLNQNHFTISSVNTILEGMMLMSSQVPALMMDTLENTISDYILENSKLWEVCDLCYYASEVGIMSLAVRLLDHIEQRVVQGERLTPRASIMLLRTMTQCEMYPPETLHRTTFKLSSLSPTYKISKKWLKVLAETRPKLAIKAHIMLSFKHSDWEDRLQVLQMTE